MIESMRVRDLCMKLLESLYAVRFTEDFRQIIISKPGMPDLTITMQVARETDSGVVFVWVKDFEARNKLAQA